MEVVGPAPAWLWRTMAAWSYACAAATSLSWHPKWTCLPPTLMYACTSRSSAEEHGSYSEPASAPLGKERELIIGVEPITRIRTLRKRNVPCPCRLVLNSPVRWRLEYSGLGWVKPVNPKTFASFWLTQSYALAHQDVGTGGLSQRFGSTCVCDLHALKQNCMVSATSCIMRVQTLSA